MVFLSEGFLLLFKELPDCHELGMRAVNTIVLSSTCTDSVNMHTIAITVIGLWTVIATCSMLKDNLTATIAIQGLIPVSSLFYTTKWHVRCSCSSGRSSDRKTYFKEKCGMAFHSFLFGLCNARGTKHFLMQGSFCQVVWSWHCEVDLIFLTSLCFKNQRGTRNSNLQQNHIQLRSIKFRDKTSLVTDSHLEVYSRPINEGTLHFFFEGEENSDRTITGSTWLPDCQRVSSLTLASSEFSWSLFYCQSWQLLVATERNLPLASWCEGEVQEFMVFDSCRSKLCTTGITPTCVLALLRTWVVCIFVLTDEEFMY